MAATNLSDRGHERFKGKDRRLIIALGEGANTSAQFDHKLARRELAARVWSFELGQSLIEVFALCGNRDQCPVDISKMNARPRKHSVAIASNVTPMRFKPNLAGK